MEQPIWRHAVGYVQGEPILPAPIAAASEEFDAVACFMTRDDMFGDMTEEDAAGSAKMAADELETFSEPIPNTCLWVQEEHIRPGELGGITAYLFFANAAAARDVARDASKADDFNRICLNLRDDRMGEMNTLPFAAVLELSCSSIAGLNAALGFGSDSLLSTADLAVVSRDAVLWDRITGGERALS